MSAVRPRFPVSPFAVRSSAFLLMAIGCLGIAGQLVLLRELMAAFGGNEFSAGVTVAVWILCEALGAWLAGRGFPRTEIESTTEATESTESSEGRDSLRTLQFSVCSVVPCRISGGFFPAPCSLLSILSILFSLAAVPAATLVRPLLGVLPGETLSIPLLLLATFTVVFLPAATHGALFVAAAALHAQRPLSRASSAAFPATGGVGSAYVWEGLGTTLAGLACFLLLSRLPSLAVVALFSLPLAAAALQFRPSEPSAPAAFKPRRLVAFRFPLSAFILPPSALLAAVAVSAFIMAQPIERMAWGAAWRGQRVASVANSSYGKIVRLERAGQQLILYDGLPVLTVPTAETERTEELGLLPVLIHPQPRRVLVLGHDLAIPAALARFRPDIKIVAVQLDPLLTRAVLSALASDTSFGVPPSSPGALSFSCRIADPVSFLSSARDTFDCIILTDAVPSNLGSSRLFALEFYRLCRSRLACGGILAVAGPGSPTGLSPDLVSIVSTRQRTLKTAFEHVLPLAADFPLLLASGRPLNVVTETLLARLGRLSWKPKLLDSTYVTGLLDPFRQEAFSSLLQSGMTKSTDYADYTDRVRSQSADAPKRISSAAFPRELFLNMVRENRLVSPAFGVLYARLGSLSPRLLLLLGAVLLIIGLAGARSRGRPFSRGFAILTSGFSGAAVSSLLLFAYQVRFGSVYSGVALLVAAFMFGTVLGGILGSRSPLPIHHSSFITHRFFVSDLALAVCAAAAALLIHGGPAGAFLFANCLAGACLGFQFAVAGSGAATNRQSPIANRQSAGRRAGILTALDLAGGSLGGILTALVLVPVFGIGAAALSAGAVKLASALVQLAARRPGSQS